MSVIGSFANSETVASPSVGSLASSTCRARPRPATCLSRLPEPNTPWTPIEPLRRAPDVHRRLDRPGRARTPPNCTAYYVRRVGGRVHGGSDVGVAFDMGSPAKLVVCALLSVVPSRLVVH